MADEVEQLIVQRDQLEAQMHEMKSKYEEQLKELNVKLAESENTTEDQKGSPEIKVVAKKGKLTRDEEKKEK